MVVGAGPKMADTSQTEVEGDGVGDGAGGAEMGFVRSMMTSSIASKGCEILVAAGVR